MKTIKLTKDSHEGSDWLEFTDIVRKESLTKAHLSLGVVQASPEDDDQFRYTLKGVLDGQ